MGVKAGASTWGEARDHRRYNGELELNFRVEKLANLAIESLSDAVIADRCGPERRFRKREGKWIDAGLSKPSCTECAFTLSQLCQNYVALCIRIGRIDRLQQR
jgi:hypothetical protein